MMEHEMSVLNAFQGIIIFMGIMFCITLLAMAALAGEILKEIKKLRRLGGKEGDQ